MIVFRTDGNSMIGAGHIMRCLAIANVSGQIEKKSCFIISSDEFKERILSFGHEARVLGSDYSRLQSEEIVSIINDYEAKALFVDSYYVTNKCMEHIHEVCRKKGCKLVYIDDRCRYPFSCDVLLNYNVFARSLDYEKLYEGRAEPEFLLGTAYAPLREEFLTVEKRKTVDEAENIFVSTGGADSEHLTLELIDTAMTRQSKVFHFVVGMMNPDKEMIREKAGKSHNIVIHENVQKMAELMESCDVAISAAGSTLYELCAIGIPTLTYVIADNQIPAAREFERRGIMKNCGNIFELGKETLAKKLIDEAIKLADNKDARIKVSKLMRSLVDGKGAERILESVLQ